jgi:hypothetical protein
MIFSRIYSLDLPCQERQESRTNNSDSYGQNQSRNEDSSDSYGSKGSSDSVSFHCILLPHASAHTLLPLQDNSYGRDQSRNTNTNDSYGENRQAKNDSYGSVSSLLSSFSAAAHSILSLQDNTSRREESRNTNENNSYGSSTNESSESTTSKSGGGMNSYVEKGVEFAAKEVGYNMVRFTLYLHTLCLFQIHLPG